MAGRLASLTGYDFINNQYTVALSTVAVGQGTYIQLIISQGSTQLYNNTFLIAPTSSQVSPTACMFVVAGTAGGTTNFTSGSFTVSLLSDNQVSMNYTTDTYSINSQLPYTCSGTTYYAWSQGEGTNLTESSISQPNSHEIDFTAS